MLIENYLIETLNRGLKFERSWQQQRQNHFVFLAGTKHLHFRFEKKFVIVFTKKIYNVRRSETGVKFVTAWHTKRTCDRHNH